MCSSRVERNSGEGGGTNVSRSDTDIDSVHHWDVERLDPVFTLLGALEESFFFSMGKETKK